MAAGRLGDRTGDALWSIAIRPRRFRTASCSIDPELRHHDRGGVMDARISTFEPPPSENDTVEQTHRAKSAVTGTCSSGRIRWSSWSKSTARPSGFHAARTSVCVGRLETRRPPFRPTLRKAIDGVAARSFLAFVSNAAGSHAELETHLELARRLGLIDPPQRTHRIAHPLAALTISRVGRLP